MSMNQKQIIGGKKGIEAQKPKNIWQTIRRLLGYMKKSSLLIVLTIIIAIAGTILQVYSPKILGEATTVIFEGMRSKSGIDFNNLRSILQNVSMMFVGIFITTFLQQRIMVVVSQKTTFTLRNKLKEKMNKIPVSFFDKNSNGSLMSVAINDIDNIATNIKNEELILFYRFYANLIRKDHNLMIFIYLYIQNCLYLRILFSIDE